MMIVCFKKLTIIFSYLKYLYTQDVFFMAKLFYWIVLKSFE